MQSRIGRKLLKALFPVVLSGCAAAPDLVDRLPSFSRDRYREQVLAARMAEQSGELMRARKSYEELLKKNPDKVDLHHRLGVLCQKSGDEAAAINYLKKAHELSPANVEVLCDLGYSHYLQGRADEAVAVYRQAQQINPSHARTQSNLGIALIDVGEVSAAMTTLRQSMSESDAASTVGFALAQKGDLLQARD
jgi:Flp pilus assembly protein TadD